ncbi:MAG: LysR family transcriptional regulator, partial [Thermoleophilia bacterium]|nr:LysR family transcriptional regulator [Thermoleophilia bacterium]
GPRSVRLTDAGRALVVHAGAILARLEAAEADLHAIAGLRGGMLRLASFPTAYASLMPQAIVEFGRRHPGVDLRLTEADPLAALARLRSGEIDLALVYEYDYVPLPEDDLVERVHLFDDPIRVLLPRAHGAAPRAAVALGDLAGETWITSTVRSSCHQFVARACRAAGFEPRIGFESDDHGVWQGLVAAGVGVALAADLATSTLHEGVVARAVALRPLKRGVLAAHRAGARSAATTAMLDVLADAVPDPLPAIASVG